MAASPTTTAALPQIEPNAIPGPWHGSVWKWLEDGTERQVNAALIALVAAWTGLPIALWLAALGVVAGAIVGLVGGSQIGFVHALHVSTGVGVLGAFAGAFVGAAAGLLVIFVSYVNHPEQFIGAILSGMLIGAIALAIIGLAEPRLMHLRGYRKLSRREQERLYPLLREAGRRMKLSVVPDLWVSDSQKPAAWAHMRAIVVTRGLLGDYDASENRPKPELDDIAIAAILAHELHHWHVGDVVGLSTVWAMFWPVAVAFNVGAWLRTRSGWLGALGWIVFWPAWVITKLVVVPMMAKRSRQQEYDADARAVMLGDDYRLGLRRALDDLKEWEKPRTGWEDALAATHPPVELRLERLEVPRRDESVPEPAPGTGPVPPSAAPSPLEPTLRSHPAAAGAVSFPVTTQPTVAPFTTPMQSAASDTVDLRPLQGSQPVPDPAAPSPLEPEKRAVIEGRGILARERGQAGDAPPPTTLPPSSDEPARTETAAESTPKAPGAPKTSKQKQSSGQPRQRRARARQQPDPEPPKPKAQPPETATPAATDRGTVPPQPTPAPDRPDEEQPDETTDSDAADRWGFPTEKTDKPPRRR